MKTKVKARISLCAQSPGTVVQKYRWEILHPGERCILRTEPSRIYSYVHHHLAVDDCKRAASSLGFEIVEWDGIKKRKVSDENES